MLTLGVTGGIGSGKSTVARYFVDRGAQLFDADREAKDILLHHRDVLSAVRAAFGKGVLDDQGEIDFVRLAAAGFTSPEQQQRLNAIIHPEVIRVAHRHMADARRRGLEMFVLDVPLLFEAGMEQGLDLTLAVVAAEDIRFERALRRGRLSEADLRRRASLQLTDEDRAARADHIIENNGTLEALHRQLEQLYEAITKGNGPRQADG